MRLIKLFLFISLLYVPTSFAVLISSGNNFGDMKKSVYDTDNDGIVDTAESATIADADYGDITISSGVWNVDSNALADSDIPDTITVSNYLPLAGGELVGTVTGTTAANFDLSGDGNRILTTDPNYALRVFQGTTASPVTMTAGHVPFAVQAYLTGVGGSSVSAGGSTAYVYSGTAGSITGWNSGVIAPAAGSWTGGGGSLFGGALTVDTYKGDSNIWGFQVASKIRTGATGVDQIGMELDITSEEAPTNRVGMKIVAVPSSESPTIEGVAGLALDDAFLISNKRYGARWEHGIVFKGASDTANASRWPITSTGTLIWADAIADTPTVANGIDFTEITITGNAFASPSFSVTGAGALTANSITTNLIDGVGAVDLDYGSADITDHTFTSDGGTVILDGGVTTTGNIGVNTTTPSENIEVAVAPAASSNEVALKMSNASSGNNFTIENRNDGGGFNILRSNSWFQIKVESSDFNFPANEGLRIDASSVASYSLKLNHAYAASTPLQVLGAASQSADLAQFMDSSAVVLSKVASDGSITAPLFTGPINLASTGVNVTGTNGSLTMLGLGDGSDEAVTFDLNTTADTVTLTSSTNARSLALSSTLPRLALVDTDGTNFGLRSDTDLLFIRDDTAGAARLTIAGTSGNVGIGTGSVAANTKFEVSGTVAWRPSATQTITGVSSTILANAGMIVLDPDGDYTLTSAPTIANGASGQIVYITAGNAEANIVTVQDQDTLASSNLQLGATSRAISGKDVLTLIFDGTDWIEVSYANN